MKLIATILIVLLFTNVSAQDRIAGTVTDQATGEPLGYVKVQAVYETDTLEDITDLKGHFSISNSGSVSVNGPVLYGNDLFLNYTPTPEGALFSSDGKSLKGTGMNGLAAGVYFRLAPGTGELQKIVRINGATFIGTRSYRSQEKSAATGTFVVLCSKAGYTTASLTAGWGDTVLVVSLQQKTVPPAPTLVNNC